VSACGTSRSLGCYPLKRLFDVVGAFALLILVGPTWLASSIGLAWADRRLPFTLLMMAGRHGVPLRLPLLTPRSRTARMAMRKLTFANPSLHRAYVVFPQLCYVLWGKLSLIGPAPHHFRRSLFLQEQFPMHCRRLQGKPGLISPRIFACDPRSERLALDIELAYLERASLRYDTWLLWRLLIDKGRRR
jgi:lipopolysaccharide/colanic/teichoic acid biosynthesis glycosyltransferase